MELGSQFKSLGWNRTDTLFPGVHSTTAVEEAVPWNCVNEVIPGLFLTCAPQASNKELCLEQGFSLVLNLCGSDYVSPYRVYEYSESREAFAFRKIDGLNNFAAELAAYTSTPASTEPKARKFFINTVPALDTPTYDIENHFPEMCALIESVLCNRDKITEIPPQYTEMPSVMVHCMVGVSRSAAVVVAYLMKRAGVSKDEALSFVRCTRPVVNPNPGFQQQLQLWEDTGCLRIVDKWSALMVAHEVSQKGKIVETVEALLPMLLKSNKCAMERSYFGFLISEAHPTREELAGIHRLLKANISAAIDSEEYADVPNFFTYICEIVHSIEANVPEMMNFMKGEEEDLAWNDGFYHRVIQNIGRSGFEKDTYDTIRAFCSLLETIQQKHFLAIEAKCPRSVVPGETAVVEAPPSIALSFPFLPYMAPYAEGFVQFSELENFQQRFPTEGETVMDADTAKTMVEALSKLFIGSFLMTGAGIIGSDDDDADTSAQGRWGVNSRLCYLESDVEVKMFESLEADELPIFFGTSDEDCATALFKGVADSAVAKVIAVKALAGALAFRLLLETVEAFAWQAYGSRLSKQTDLCLSERRISLANMRGIMASIEGAYLKMYDCSPHLMEFFKARLDSLFQCGVVRGGGNAVWSLFA